MTTPVSKFLESGIGVSHLLSETTTLPDTTTEGAASLQDVEDEEEDLRDLENLLERLACLRLATCPGCNWCKIRALQPCHLATLSRVPQPVDQLPIDSVSHQVQLGLRNIAQLTEQLRAGFHTEEEIIRLNNHLAYEQDNLLATAKEDRAWTLVVRRSFKRSTMGRTLPQPAHLRRLAQARRAARIGSATPSTSTSNLSLIHI